MKRLLAIIAAMAVSTPAAAQPGGFAGQWEGLMRIPGEPVAFSVRIAPTGEGWLGTITVPGRAEEMELESVAVRGDSVILRLPNNFAELRGALGDGGTTIRGRAQIEEGNAPFAMARAGSAQAAALAQEAAAPPPQAHAHPDSARIIADDIPRFWAAWDASTPQTRAEALQRMYLDAGSPGLEDMTFRRIGNARILADSLGARGRYLESARASTLRVFDFQPQIREAFRRFEALYPEGVYPDVYFLIGRMNSGGTASPRALLIGTELFGRTEGMPEDELNGWLRAVIQPVDALPYIVAHELVHYQQDYAPGQTLLRQAIAEGVADFIAELISGRHINVPAHAYGEPRQQELWCEFRTQMQDEEVRGWMYNGASAGDRPADLGYFVGYKIAQAYHARAADPRQAVRDMLTIQDFDAFLAASGYDERFTCPAAPAQ